MALQLFGTLKCQETRKAERWLKERGIEFQFRDISIKPFSPGELDSVAKAVGGCGSLIDTKAKSYVDAGLAYMDYDSREELLANPLILKTPVLRDGPRALAGFDAKAFEGFVKS